MEICGEMLGRAGNLSLEFKREVRAELWICIFFEQNESVMMGFLKKREREKDG